VKLSKFKKDFDGAPFLLEEFAELAEKVTDCTNLKEAAQEFLEAKEEFERQLECAGVGIG